MKNQDYLFNLLNPGKKSFIYLFLVISSFIELFSQGIGCDQLKLSVTLQPGTTCCYKLTVDNKAVDNCFQQINLNISPDIFQNIVGLNNFQVGAAAGGEFSIRPRVGFIPNGKTDIATFCVKGGPISTIIALWDNFCKLEGCEQIIKLSGCPWKGSIQGIKYVDIGCSGKAYKDQPVLKDWEFSLCDENGAEVQTTITDEQGVYSFLDLKPGSYTIKEKNKTGWKFSAPTNGQQKVELGIDESKGPINFGNCPTTCSCDSIYVDLINKSSGSDWTIYVFHRASFCFSEIIIENLSGDIPQADLLLAGWKKDQVSRNKVILTGPQEILPSGSLEPCKFRFTSTLKDRISLKITVPNRSNGPNSECSYDTELSLFPNSPNQCCPTGTRLGPNIICNGNFDVTNPSSTNPPFCIKSDYTYFSGPAIGPPSYTVGDASTVSAANGGNWVCVGLNGPSDNFMIIDASGNNISIWKQLNIPVTPNTDYSFNLWMTCIDRLDPQGIPYIRIEFNGSSIGNMVAPWGYPWTKFEKCWNSGNSTTLDIAIKLNQNIGANDFAFDSIGLKECIKIDTCKCGPKVFSSMLYRPMQGAPSVSVRCGDTLMSKCKNTIPFTLSGLFECSDSMCRPSSLTWYLNKPNGSQSSGPVNWASPNFNLSIPSSQFSSTGFYSLTLVGICGMDICECNFIVCVECCLEDFEDDIVGTKGSWLVKDGSISVINDAPPHLHVLRGDDASGGSYFYNNIDYSGNWIQQYNGCFCFDLKYDANDVSNPLTGKYTLNIFNGTNIANSSLRAIFVCSTGVGNSWQRICAPISLASSTTLPSNADGYWQMIPNTATPADFNTLIQGVGGISIALDFASGSSPSEILYLDNICIEKCITTDTCYCGSFDFLYSLGRGPLLPKKCGDTLHVGGSQIITPIKFLSEFKCSGLKCPAVTVDWVLTGPPGFIPISMNGIVANPGFTIPITNNTFTLPGIYALTMVGHCGAHLCPCTIYFEASGYTCCATLEDFCDVLMQAVNVSVDNRKCKATVSIGNFPKCIYIERINWGDNQSSFGPFTSGMMPMHSYAQSGLYIINYLAIEKDPNTGFICREKFFSDTIRLNCDTCKCRSFTSMVFANFNWLTPNIPVGCNQNSIALPCTKPGEHFWLHGYMNCSDQNCIKDSLKWTLQLANGTPVTSGTNYINPGNGHFDIILNTSLFNPNVQYSIIVTGMCGNNVCRCQVNFSFMPCPCPCDSLKKDVIKGFYVSGNSKICKRSFKPKDLCPNDIVSWHITGPNNYNQTFGPSSGNNSYMFAFPGSGIYKVCMIVARTNNGVVCNKDSFCRKVIVKCKLLPPIERITLCDSADVVTNGDFTEGAKAGHLGEGGQISNWNLVPNPGDGVVIVNDSLGAEDDGSIVLIGNKNNFAGISQEIGLITDNYVNVSFELVNYLDDNSLEADIVFRLECCAINTTSNRFEILRKKVMKMNDDKDFQKFNFSIPMKNNQEYNSLVVCLQNQSDASYSVVGIDNIEMCTSKIPLWVSVSDPVSQSEKLNIYPNPNDGTFIVESSIPATSDMLFKIIDLAGKEQRIIICDEGKNIQTIEVSSLSSGFYFLQLVKNGKVKSVSKFIKN